MKALVIALCITFSLYAKSPPGTCVTYSFSSGRFGDNLMSYLHGKWVSYRYNIPLAYRPFPLSEKLQLHVKERYHIQSLRSLSAKRKIVLYHDKFLLPKTPEPIFYLLPYYDEKERRRFGDLQINWNDVRFKKLIHSLVAPIKNLPKLTLPTDRVSIALHVRTGVGFDSPEAWKLDPLKFPPLSYYIEQIKKIAEIYDNEPLHVQLFTDDPNPRMIIKQIEEELYNYPISYDWRKRGNRHNANVLEDFFQLMQCDCLIRSHSSFSLVAGKVRNYEVEIFPLHHIFRKGEIVIDKVQLKLKN